ncbi:MULTISPECIES: glucose-6-phosphate isomerase family protein [Enterococcus]|uniref:glucose-6-phosphate isomerase family protein n=1 Tax=Enterococcus TaxID=1350 RepID=UPI0010FFA621|nr:MULTISPECIES: glucose-6-phosphate isomerase family protein [Enterococcus]QCT91109.1 glucose-6-phosphate isomerase [Enterococcus sp. M190262]GMG58150.1 hypothetical protein AH4_15710 [Enterococcus gallinarum]
MIETGLGITFDENSNEFLYPAGTFGPSRAEQRYLKDILHSMANHDSKGPDIVYSIAMDVGLVKDQADLVNRELLFGIVAYAAGSIGDEPIKSQGHIHASSKTCQMSTPEVYEIWSGEGIIYMQENGSKDPGRCYAVQAKAGEVVIVPPGWAHCTINASRTERLVFGAWCVRDYGFEYKAIRAHNGLAFYPKFTVQGKLIWIPNTSYQTKQLIEKNARQYSEFAIEENVPIYQQYEQENTKFDFVVRPDLWKEEWLDFVP